MFTKFSRSWDLIKASGDVLRQDKELLLFPVFSSIAAMLVIATFIVPLIATGVLAHSDYNQSSDRLLIVVGFLFYLALYFVIYFFNASLIGAALIRLDGGDPTVADGLRIARSRIISILCYAAIAATVGLILRAIEDRAGFIGKWIAGLLGVAFTVATFLTVPILVSREISAVDAVKESASLLKSTWGENIIGNSGMGIVFSLIYGAIVIVGMFLVFAVSGTGSMTLMILAFALLVVAVMVVSLIHSALQGVYAAALYRYATDGNVGAGFSSTLLDTAFRIKS